MKLYSSFLIRCWLIQDSSQGERSVIDIEHIQSGGHIRAATLSEAENWILEACRATLPVAKAIQRAGEKARKDE
jgi:hypothetical protein